MTIQESWGMKRKKSKLDCISNLPLKGNVGESRWVDKQMADIGHWRHIWGHNWGTGGWFEVWRAGFMLGGLIEGLEGRFEVWRAVLRHGGGWFEAKRADLRPGGLNWGLGGLIWGLDGQQGGGWTDGRTEGRKDGRTDGRTDVSKFPPVFYRTSALWGRCPKSGFNSLKYGQSGVCS